MDSIEVTDYLDGSEIAIVGMACRFPGARNVDEFWQNLCDGVESISFFTDEELRAAGVDPAELEDPNYVRAAPILEDVEYFDASFFGYSPGEAESMDPQQRILLECAWEGLENAGYDSERYRETIGVYVGAKTNTYLHNLLSNRSFLESQGILQAIMGSDLAFLSTRISYKLDLTGPSYMVQTACSTALVAVHMACQSLLNGECQMALAGGIAVIVPHKTGYFYQPGDIVSPDGHCRAFDAKAEGTIFGSGAGIVVLKRLEDALADGDHIHAIIKGSATNNDGALKASFTSPSVEGQTSVIIEALACAGIEADSISYVEAHGTGTALGDPIEILALTNAFRASTSKKDFCAIGSVKTNFGHLDAAAGIAGLIKTVLTLKHQMLPPTLHFQQPNPKIDFANGPFYVNTMLSKWRRGDTPRRAGVSSFGFGGTNAHVILEEPPSIRASGDSRSWQVLVLSAKTESALETTTTNLVQHLKQHPYLNLADVAYTLQVGRRAFNHRRVVVCHELDDAVNALETLDPRRVFTASPESLNRPIVFMFSGQGAQYVNMARGLYQEEPTFREQVDRSSSLLRPHLGFDLCDVMFPDASRAREAVQQTKQTAIAQPALFVIEYALAQLWMSWGVQPQAMIGHSIGEYVAACLAGVLSLEDALRLVAARGHMMQQMPGGSMLVVPLPENEVRHLLNQELSLAVVNGPALCVVSGPSHAVDELEQQLTDEGMHCRRLHTSHAFHSAMMDPVLEPFTEQVRSVKLQAPQIPYISNVTGTWITAEESSDASYWAKHLRQTVRFADGMGALLSKSSPVLLEVGPGQTLSTLAKRCNPYRIAELAAVLSSVRHPQDEQSDEMVLLNALSKLWLAGGKVDWHRFSSHERRHRLPLPTYPFERQRYWIEADEQPHPMRQGLAPPGKNPDIAEWFYIPSWKRSMPPRPFELEGSKGEGQPWLVFVDECGVGAGIVERLTQAGQEVVSVRVGSQFGQGDGGVYTVNPRRSDDYSALLKKLNALDKFPSVIVHLWTVTPMGDEWMEGRSLEQVQNRGFYSLLSLAQALGEQGVVDSLQLWIVSSGLHKVEDRDVLHPGKATILGPCRVIPQEYPHVSCCSVDVVVPSSNTQREEREKLIDHLVAEIGTSLSDTIVAYRGDQRWVQTYEPVQLASTAGRQPSRLREGGVYLITGGLGGIGLVLAEYLTQTARARLILTRRSPFPERDHWEQWLATHNDQNKVGVKIRKLQALEDLGAEVMVASADVTNQEQMQAVIDQAHERFGAIHGVIHAAGIAGGGMIQLKTAEMAAAVLAPKVSGALILDSVLRNEELDFFVLFSSLSSILGELGQADYCAANAFLDAFAHSNVSGQKGCYMSINWDMWQEVGLAANTEVPPDLKEWREEQLKYAISPDEGIEALGRVLDRSTVPQVIVCPQDIHAVIEVIDDFTQPRFLEEMERIQSPGPAHPRPKNISTSYVAPRDEPEQAVAEIWQQVLRIEKVGVYDNFFDLGGHSLLGIQVISRLRELFQVDLSPRHIFEASTVAELAAKIEELLIEEIDALTEEEVRHILEEE